MEAIGEAFRSEFADPMEELPYESREGGYQGVLFDTWKLFFRIGEAIGVEEFVDDVITAFGACEWCRRDYFIATEDEALTFSWERFAELVKHHQRFLILGNHEKDDEPHEVEPAEMLRSIGALVVEAGLIREIPPGTVIWRVRPHAAELEFTTAAELGTAPREVAFSNRMSPAGIPLFYGALDAETSRAEVWPEPEAGKEAATIASFANSETLPVVDLASIPSIPSIFDAKRRSLRARLRFLHAFADRISEPVTNERSDREVVEYVPTQIVSEYFRTLFGGEQTPVRGMLFRSSRHEGGTNCVLFMTADECIDESPPEGELRLVLETVETLR